MNRDKVEALARAFGVPSLDDTLTADDATNLLLLIAALIDAAGGEVFISDAQLATLLNQTVLCEEDVAAGGWRLKLQPPQTERP